MRNRIKELRAAAGFSQEKLAELAGTTNQQISRLEKGERKLSQEWMETLAPILGCKPAALIEPPIGGDAVKKSGQFIHEPDELRLIDLWRKIPVEAREALITLAIAAVNARTGNPDVA